MKNLSSQTVFLSNDLPSLLKHVVIYAGLIKRNIWGKAGRQSGISNV
jgi:hypothetical protein